jgi:very-short-patch-repair endonuclease
MRQPREQSHPETWRRLRDRVREFRANPTQAEEYQWKALRSRPGGFKFRRQHAIRQYVVDFYCVAARLVVEVDGPIHGTNQADDAYRQAFLETLDLRVLRFLNDEVLMELPTVVNRIVQTCNERTEV